MRISLILAHPSRTSLCSTMEQRAQWLVRAAELMRLHFPVLTGGPANAAA